MTLKARTPLGQGFASAILVAIFLVPAAAVSAQPRNDQGAYGKVIRIDRSGFKPSAGKITFDEFPVNTVNPVYPPSAYGGDASGVTVTFAGFFTGQRKGDARSCQGGGAITGCVAGKPSAPLTLDQSSPKTQISTDAGSPDSPVLGGTPTFNGPVTMLFDKDIAGVGLQGGFFNAVQGTAILAFDRQGRQIGGVVNLAKGMEYMALVTEDGSETIAGLQFALVGPEPYGFAIDEVSFAQRKDLQMSAKPAGGGAAPGGGGGGSLSDLFKKAPQADPAPGGAPAAAPPPKGSLKDLFK